MYRHKFSPVLRDSKGRLHIGSTKFPKIPLSNNDIYVVTSIGDRVDTLAQTYYKDSSLWWVISIANSLPKDTLNIAPGSQLRIPQNIQMILNQLKVLNS